MAALAPLPQISAEAPDFSALKADIQAVLGRMEESFNAASTQLCHAVGKIETIVSRFTEVAHLFDGGVGADAIEGLRAAAGSLLAVRDVVKQRSGEITALHEASRAIRHSTSLVLRCLQVLDIYGMNVKITAAGRPQFMEFADAMRGKLDLATAEMHGLDQMLDGLAQSLDAMSRTDHLLGAECAKVIPQVPEALLREAANLQAHQSNLGNLARLTSSTATAIQAELHAAIAAIQIGDRVRQRFEHILKGLGLTEQAVAASDLPPHQSADILTVLAALSTAAAKEYSRDTTQLSASLVRLHAECEKLGHLNDSGSDQSDRDMLARIECSVGEAHAMLRELDRANTDATATMKLILRAVDEVNERQKSIGVLRLDVQHMAINIGLSCRTAPTVGRPVMVIANEIRSYSERLDGICEMILKDQERLSEPCHQLQDRLHDHAAASGDVLADFLATIGDCNRKGQEAMGTVQAEAQQLRVHLASSMSLLEEARALDRSMRGIGDNLDGQARQSVGADQPSANTVQGILDQLARAYTMADEREVHNRSLAPGYTPITILQDVPPQDDDDEDDGLF